MDLTKGKDMHETLETSFRSSLTDLVTLAEKLVNYCKTTEDLVNVARVALENDSQLRLLINLAMTRDQKR